MALPTGVIVVGYFRVDRVYRVPGSYARIEKQAPTQVDAMTNKCTVL